MDRLDGGYAGRDHAQGGVGITPPEGSDPDMKSLPPNYPSDQPRGWRSD
jgi:hypothetical protein